jgi:hypothetical protein
MAMTVGSAALRWSAYSALFATIVDHIYDTENPENPSSSTAIPPRSEEVALGIYAGVAQNDAVREAVRSVMPANTEESENLDGPATRLVDYALSPLGEFFELQFIPALEGLLAEYGDEALLGGTVAVAVTGASLAILKLWRDWMRGIRGMGASMAVKGRAALGMMTNLEFGAHMAKLIRYGGRRKKTLLAALIALAFGASVTHLHVINPGEHRAEPVIDGATEALIRGLQETTLKRPELREAVNYILDQLARGVQEGKQRMMNMPAVPATMTTDEDRMLARGQALRVLRSLTGSDTRTKELAWALDVLTH